MCWISSKLTPTVTTAPLKVYKVGIFENDFTSLFQLFKYEPHVIYKSEIEAVLKFSSICVSKALHSYDGDLHLSISNTSIVFTFKKNTYYRYSSST